MNSSPCVTLCGGTSSTIFPSEKGGLVLGVPSEGTASSNPQKLVSLKGFAKRNAEDLIYRGLATRDACGGIVPMNFVTQQMLDAYEREKKSFRNAKRHLKGIVAALRPEGERAPFPAGVRPGE
ncbi:hypothetical protein [Salipiger aestuarii]|uniref:hypothetical protein n=1 Tax=Salipiger aestuarii TaxID=568098 RepID=UPI001CC2CF70|nr:hypothetical protein [Salipiger aestuarii]